MHDVQNIESPAYFICYIAIVMLPFSLHDFVSICPLAIKAKNLCTCVITNTTPIAAIPVSDSPPPHYPLRR